LLLEPWDFDPPCGLLAGLALCFGALCTGAETLGLLALALFGCALRGDATCRAPRVGAVRTTRCRVAARPVACFVCRAFALTAGCGAWRVRVLAFTGADGL